MAGVVSPSSHTAESPHWVLDACKLFEVAGGAGACPLAASVTWVSVTGTRETCTPWQACFGALRVVLQPWPESLLKPWWCSVDAPVAVAVLAMWPVP